MKPHPSQTPNLFQQIIKQPENAENFIGNLDPESTDDRNQTLATINLLIEKFVEPSKSFLIHHFDDPEYWYFDPEAVAETEISGLVLGLLNNEFPSLQAPPDDSYLRTIFDNMGITIHEAEKRQHFFQTWMALRTTNVIRKLVTLFKTRNNLDNDENQREIKKIELLIESALPSLDKKIIEKIITSRKDK
jgi:hypothetical protein